LTGKSQTNGVETTTVVFSLLCVDEQAVGVIVSVAEELSCDIEAAPGAALETKFLKFVVSVAESPAEKRELYLAPSLLAEITLT
jgi:hypothetical protein